MRSPAAALGHANTLAQSQDHGFQPEIQGMRALSVLAVVFAHAGVSGLAGGFIGVDVFFVISGFLITRLLVAELARTGRIDLLAFWARRARRLLPNAFATLLVTVLLALFLFPGYEPSSLAREISFAALEVVNFHFGDKAVDYFQQDGPASPVLHFWSLAVEEQFYAIWPVLLLTVGLMFRRSAIRSATILLALIWCASFAANIVLTAYDQPLAYFNTGTRCWQLATGALLAICWPDVERWSRGLRIVMAWGGLAAILGATAFLGEGQGYPGFWALLPTLGAAGVLAGFGAVAPESLLRRSLNQPMMQWIGARSYSWYLWHWPLIALPRITFPDSPYIEVIAVPVSLVVACCAYSWIETPFRKGTIFRAPALPTLAGALAALGIVVGAGQLYQPVLLLIDKTAATRFAWIEAAARDFSQGENEQCLVSDEKIFQPDCPYGDAAGRYRVVLFGDSHAAHWFAPLNAAAKQAGWQLRLNAKPACPAAEVSVRRKGKRYITCDQWRESVMAQLTTARRPDLVVISNRTSFDYGGAVYDPATGEQIFGDQAQENWKAGLRKTITRLVDAGIEVLVIRDVPRMEKSYRNCLLTGEECAAPRKSAVERFPAMDAEVARAYGNRILLADFTDQFCTAALCPGARNGVILYRDTNHLTATYAATYTPQMTQYLQLFAERLQTRTSKMAAGKPQTQAPLGTGLQDSALTTNTE
jgi:peptidoglycan/LPS O-acetylase OafA/YrhL